jgi:hypothetical protein
MWFSRKCCAASMALPYIPQTIIDKYFNDYMKLYWQTASRSNNIYFGNMVYILRRKRDESRIIWYDAYMTDTAYTLYWDHFHNFIVYVRLLQLQPYTKIKV